MQACRLDVSASPLAKSLCMLVMLTPPIRPCFLHLCISAAQLELTFRLGPFDADGYLIVLSGSCHVQTSTGHTQGLIRAIHGSWWVMFFLSPAGPESSVAVSQSEESGCVNRIKGDTVDFGGILYLRWYWILCNEWNLGQLSKMERVLDVVT